MRNFALATIVSLAMGLTMGLSVGEGSAVETRTGSDSRAYLNSFNLPSSGLALEGYCPVAYQAVNKPLRGKPEYSSTYNGVTYQFVSSDAKRLFDRDPDKYVPAYGGWCAFGMSIEDKFPIDPTNFKIIDGQLHVFLRNKNIDALELWNNGRESELMKKADAYWKIVSK